MVNDRKDNGDDAGLDALFAQARDDGPSNALMARVMGDAEAVQAQLAARPVVVPEVPKPGLFALLAGAVGGWSAVSGITAAGVMGLAVGLYSPDTVAAWLESDTLSLGISGYEIAPDLGALWTEDGDV